ncbi:MAG: M23 family metallopeptidase [Clostridia bacterium]|nr:M23 family metallopeptidase [Clostridia bacterium]
MMDYAYLVTLCAAIAVVAGAGIYTHRIRTQYASDVAAAAPAPETQQTPSPALSPLPTIAPLEPSRHALTRGTVWPVSGRVLRPYEEQEAVYWEALGSYRVHKGLDIRGEAGEEVRCAADGTVESVRRDALWGYSVTIEQTDGRTAVYAGLGEAWPAAGENVTRGTGIGRLLERIPCEAEMETHLHMELYRDKKPQDPEGILPER